MNQARFIQLDITVPIIHLIEFKHPFEQVLQVLDSKTIQDRLEWLIHQSFNFLLLKLEDLLN